MDQKKTGLFLKELRNEKKLTQEQLAEIFHVSSRTISRWETGNTLPDISLLVEIADFYDVDVREIIEGGRKSEMMNEELKDVANKMADYADNENGKQFGWIQCLSFTGVVILALALFLQCKNYNPGIITTGAVLLTFIALIISSVITLHVTGKLTRIVKSKKFATIKVATIVVLVVVIGYLIKSALVVGLLLLTHSDTFEHVTDIETYNKEALVKEHSRDWDAFMFVFPDSTDNMRKTSYDCAFNADMFSTYGYVILKAEYDRKAYEAELKRLSQVTCTFPIAGDETLTQEIIYDEESYYYPAYIAYDGYKDLYEYALIDDEENTITYVLVSFPEPESMEDYKLSLKKDWKAYETEAKNSLKNFSIYADTKDGTDIIYEYELEDSSN